MRKQRKCLSHTVHTIVDLHSYEIVSKIFIYEMLNILLFETKKKKKSLGGKQILIFGGAVL